MKVAIISDIHENFHNLILALKEIENQGCEQILCLGDLMNSGVAKVLSCSKIPVFMVWGNNDGEKVEIMDVAYRKGSNLKVSAKTYDFLTIDKKKLFICHYDDLAVPMAKSGMYDAVFFGHTHIGSMEKVGNTLVVNPGEISAHKTGAATFTIYDTTSNTAKTCILEGIKSLRSDMVTEYFKKHKEALGLRSHKAFDI